MRAPKLSRAQREARRRWVTPRRVVAGPGLDALRELLWFAAPQIEVAGSIDRAIECGLIGGFGDHGAMLDLLRSAVPISRGGEMAENEEQWQQFVAAAIEHRDIDIDRLRELMPDPES